MTFDCVFLNGTVGTGKTTTAEMLSKHVSLSGVRNAVIDLDEIRRSWPAPLDDPFNHELELRNLASLVGNYRDAGADRFILAGVIEQRSELPRYRAAVQSEGMFVARLVTDPGVLEARLLKRHEGDPEAIEWYLERAVQLAGILETADCDDRAFDTTDQSATEVAAAISSSVGW
ncbi:AAA family ATPase [Diaminobutyricibacter sp. McL0608]|uniref:AAA family ATPase n=1 Tax=Leifsonia sp. McL0608 TaxID=3143537 RepID=UPI0031F31E80